MIWAHRDETGAIRCLALAPQEGFAKIEQLPDDDPEVVAYEARLAGVGRADPLAELKARIEKLEAATLGAKNA